MKIKHRGKTINLAVKQTNSFTKISGLMFRSKNTKNLYLEFPSEKLASIHSYFVFFPFLAIWLDEKSNVIDHKVVKPFTFLVKSKSPSKRLIEIPLNVRNNKIVNLLDGEGKV